jgi:hypothetical protein
MKAYSKAIAAFLGSFIPALTVPLIAGHLPTQSDLLTALGLALAATTAVYFAPKNSTTR